MLVLEQGTYFYTQSSVPTFSDVEIKANEAKAFAGLASHAIKTFDAYIKALPQDWLLAGAIFALAALSIWILIGWDMQDARTSVKRWWDALVSGLGSVLDRFHGVAANIAGLLGFGLKDTRTVSLGEVAEMIDVVCLGLEAGLSFDASLALYCESKDIALAQYISQARFAWQVGLATREQGLLQVARDAELHQLESFAIAVTQALELGAPLASTLEAQGKEIRAAHRADVERQIERAPIKLLIPTGTLILPALLLSIVGPLVAAGGLM